jgi:hypothetical protein
VGLITKVEEQFDIACPTSAAGDLHHFHSTRLLPVRPPATAFGPT